MSRPANILTIAICTYRRPALLKACLSSLENQVEEYPEVNLLVIDNAEEPVVQNLAASYGASYYHEPSTGLSHARNRAISVSQHNWLLYFDDDAIAHPDLVRNLLCVIYEHPQIKAVGGWFTHKLADDAPKWLPYHYRTPYRVSDSTVLCQLMEGEYVPGGIMAFDRELLERVGGFNPAFGMNGLEINYGEEDDLQDRIRSSGEGIWFSPEMQMEHLVHEQRYTIRVHLKMERRHGEQWARLTGNAPISLLTLMGRWGRVLLRSLPVSLSRTLFTKGYYWQNAVTTVGGRLLLAWGMYRG